MDFRYVLRKAVGPLLIVGGTCAANGLLAQHPSATCTADGLRQARQAVFASPQELRERVFSSDLRLLAFCGGEAAEDADRAMDLVRRSDYVPQICSYPVATQREGEVPCESLDGRATQPMPAVKAFACDQADCHVEYLQRRDRQITHQLFGKSGGLPFAAWLGHAGVAGHHEITRAAFADLQGWRFSQRAVIGMAKASRDADFYEWKNPAAHAQLAALDEGRCYRVHGAALDRRCGSLAQSSDEGMRSFTEWVVDKFRIARKWCEARQPVRAAYLTGYALHAVQDMVFHEGMSNAEHAFEDDDCGEPLAKGSSCIDSGFRYAEKFTLATQVTRQFVQGWLARLDAYGGCAQAMARLDLDDFSTDRMTSLERTDGWVDIDFTPIEYRKYNDLPRQITTIYYECGELPCEKPDRYRLQPKWLGWTESVPKQEVVRRASAVVDDLLRPLR